MELEARNSPVKVQALCPGYTLSEFHDVLHMDRSVIPSKFWMTADFVVDESLRGFDEGKLFVIPGWRYKLLIAGARIVPKVVLRKIAAAGVKRFRKPKNG